VEVAGGGANSYQVGKYRNGNGSAAERNFLAPPYYSQRAVFASPLSAFFITSEPTKSAITFVSATSTFYLT